MKIFSKRWSYFRGYSFERSFSIQSSHPLAKALGKLGMLAYIGLVIVVMIRVATDPAASLWPLIFIPLGFIALMAWGVLSILFVRMVFGDEAP